MRTLLIAALLGVAWTAHCQTTAPAIAIPRGDRITLRFPCQYPDGSAVNISNWTLEASIRASLTGAAVTNYTETAGEGGTNGYLTWSWDVGLAPGRYLLGFRWTTSDGITFTPLPRAPFTVLPSLLSPTNGEAIAGSPPSRGGDPREWIFTSTVSPTAGSVQSLAVNVGLRGPAGAQGPQGDPASTNGLVGADSLGLLAWSNDVPWALVTGEPTFLVPTDTNGFVGYASLGTLAWSNDIPWALVTGEPTFLVPGDTNGFVKASITNGLAGGTYINPDTNWWAVFDVKMDRRNATVDGWPDITIAASTNGFSDGMPGSACVFYMTTTNLALNGVPTEELFTTNWYPWVIRSWTIGLPNFFGPTAQKRDGEMSWQSIIDDVGWSQGDTYSVTILIKDSSPWFNPSFGAVWYYLRSDNTSNERDAQDNNDAWRRIEPIWVTYDPRPKRLYFHGGSGQDGFYEVPTPHSQP